MREYATHESRIVVEGDRSVLPAGIVEPPVADDLNIEETRDPLVPSPAVGTASGAISPRIPSRKGKAPGWATDVEVGSKRDMEVGTEIVEKIPASLSSSSGEPSKRSPARLILFEIGPKKGCVVSAAPDMIMGVGYEL